MSQPTATDVHVDKILTSISVAYIQDQTNFVAPRVFPIIPVDKQSDKYFTYTQNDWFRDEAQIRGPSQESAGSGWNLSTDNYSCDSYALHKDLDNQTLQNADAPLNLLSEATEYLTQMLLLRMERQWVSDYFTTSVWDDDFVPTNTWDDYSNSDPVDDVELGKETILKATGKEPNVMVIGYQAWRKLKHHPDLLDRIKYTERAVSAADLLAGVFGVDKIMVARSIFASNQEGATASYDFNFGKHALLCYSTPSPGLLTATAGYTFAWRGVSRGIGAEVGISQFPMLHLRSQRVEAEKAWDNKVVATNMGYFFNGAVA